MLFPSHSALGSPLSPARQRGGEGQGEGETKAIAIRDGSREQARAAPGNRTHDGPPPWQGEGRVTSRAVACYRRFLPAGFFLAAFFAAGFFAAFFAAAFFAGFFCAFFAAAASFSAAWAAARRAMGSRYGEQET